MLSKKIQREIRPRLERAFQDRFRGVLLFGSEARNQAGEDSDLDLMVVLSGPVQLGRDLEIITRTLYPLQLEVDRPIHALPVAADVFDAGQYGLYRSARKEGRYL